MRFKSINKNSILKGRNAPHKLQGELEEFMNMNVEAAEVSFIANEYKSTNSCYSSLYKSIKRFGYPIQVVVRDGKLYLIRKDM